LDRIKFAALAAALATAVPAGATQKMPPPPTARQQPSSSAAAPARAPAAPAAPVASPAAAAPAAARPTALESTDAPAPEWRVGPALGLEFGMGDQDYSAVKIRIEAQRPVRLLSPATTLSFVGSLGMAHASGNEDVVVSVDPFFGIVQTATVEWDANVFELIPAARITHVATPRISFFADGGIGLVYTAARSFVPSSTLGQLDLVEDGVGGVVRLAGGIVIAPSPALRIHLEAVGLHLRFGDGPGTAFNLVASISHRL
jgi:hypothetical protein